MEQEASVKITELEQHVRDNTRRIEGLERGQETLNRLVTAVEVLAQAILDLAQGSQIEMQNAE